MTKGREIENYLDYSNLTETISNVHPNVKFELDRNPYSNLLQYESGGKKVTMSKVNIAKYYTEHFIPDYSILDLDNQINKLCKFIISAN